MSSFYFWDDKMWYMGLTMFVYIVSYLKLWNFIIHNPSAHLSYGNDIIMYWLAWNEGSGNGIENGMQILAVLETCAVICFAL